jgi:hypothetical protein
MSGCEPQLRHLGHEQMRALGRLKKGSGPEEAVLGWPICGIIGVSFSYCSAAGHSVSLGLTPRQDSAEVFVSAIKSAFQHLVLC